MPTQEEIDNARRQNEVWAWAKLSCKGWFLMGKIKNCIICGREFETDFLHRKCCSSECSIENTKRLLEKHNAARYPKTKKNCVICGKGFFAGKRQVCCSKNVWTKITIAGNDRTILPNALALSAGKIFLTALTTGYIAQLNAGLSIRRIKRQKKLKATP